MVTFPPSSSVIVPYRIPSGGTRAVLQHEGNTEFPLGMKHNIPSGDVQLRKIIYDLLAVCGQEVGALQRSKEPTPDLHSMDLYPLPTLYPFFCHVFTIHIYTIND